MFLYELRLKNFKSFKNASIKFSEGVTAIIGPNGSGKSNIVDSLRFVFGEKKLKRLRVKRASELINVEEGKASVEALLKEGEELYSIKRIIKKDGKVKYFINDKEVTFGSFKEFLRKKGIRAVDTFVIAQGEITKITLMNPKERRIFIDELSGVAEFEEKKKEALKELEVVDGKIKEVNIIMGEKLKYLEQLKKEKEIAEEWEKKKKRLTNIKATLIKRNIDELEEKKLRVEEKKKNLETKKQEAEKLMRAIEEKINKIYKDRERISKEINLKTKRSELYKKIEEKRTKKAVLEEKLKNEEANLKEKIKLKEEIEEEIRKGEEEIKSLEKENKELSKEEEKIKIEDIKKVKKDLLELRARKERLQQSVEEIDKLIIRATEKLNSVLSSIEDNKAVLPLLEEEEENLGEIEKEIKELKLESSKLFSNERELNEKVVECDRKIIKIREKLAVLRASVGVQKVNPIDVFLHDLVKNNKLEGFYGKAIDLIEFDEKLAYAVEAAGGGRLSYYVVESLDVAKKAIEYIKKMKLGRAYFIPLRELRVKEQKKENALKNLVYLSQPIENGEKLIEFLFSNTVLVKNFEEARKLIGKERVVTLDGELFEITAVVGGGRGKGTLVAKKSIENLEKELQQITEERKELLKKLSEIKERASEIRSRRTFLEKKMEELSKASQQKSERKKKKQEIKALLTRLEAEKNKLESILNDLKLKKEKIKIEYEEERKKLEEMEKKEGIELEKKMSEREMLIKRKIQIQERISSNKKRIEELKNEIKSLNKKKEEVEKELEKMNYEISKIRDEYSITEGELISLEEEFAKKEEEIKELLKENRKIEELLIELSKKDREARDAISTIEKHISKFDVEIATIKTRIEDLKGELDRYEGFVFIEGEKEELSEEMQKLEKELEEMGEINFAAKELYFKLYDEVGEIKDRIEKLKIEKEKIIELIAEIDEKKKNAFLSHYEEVNRNFKSLFSNISGFGEGSLYLDDPSSPFESGLNMKLTRGEREIPLESLSGGEQTIMSLLFVFALQLTKPSPFYLLDEIDAALDKLNSKRMSELIKNLSKTSQIIIISHNDIVIANADTIIGVSKINNTSKAVQLKAEMLKARANS